jgi:hypothetical protein
VIIVDDHLALLAISGLLPDIGQSGAVATTWGFHFRLARAIADSSRTGSLSRRAANPELALRRILHPPAHRLVVLDPRASVESTVKIAVNHKVNLLLAELIGAALHHGAGIRMTFPNVGKAWPAIMEAESMDFVAVDI